MDASDWSDCDDPDLWADPVRKWMMDWHTPVKRMWCRPYPRRGGGITVVSPVVVLQGYVTEDFSHFYGTEDGTTIYIPEP